METPLLENVRFFEARYYGLELASSFENCRVKMIGKLGSTLPKFKNYDEWLRFLEEIGTRVTDFREAFADIPRDLAKRDIQWDYHREGDTVVIVYTVELREDALLPRKRKRNK